MYQASTIRAERFGHGYVELCFDRQEAAINKLDRLAIDELAEAVRMIASLPDLRGVLIASAKDGFIAGADVTELPGMFELPQSELTAIFTRVNQVMCAIEDLPAPTVVAINGFALGGGFELSLSADMRVVADTAQIGLPEVDLGIFPGFGGTVRLPRLAGVQTALDWITGGKPADAQAAKSAGVIDEIAPADGLRQVALALLDRAAAGEIDWRRRRNIKCEPIPQAAQGGAILESALPRLEKQVAWTHQPAALAAVRLMAQSIHESRDAALRRETVGFVEIARTQAANSLLQIFLNGQQLKRRAKELARHARPVGRAAVLGAGIMGGGIAYASAVRSVPVLLKDIDQKQLDLGSGEARKLLAKQVSAGRMEQERADGVLASIAPQLDYGGIDSVDVVIEAVVENIAVKHAVLREVEAAARADAIIASNTSSLRIDDLARALKRPENFVGMHFFNPAPVMPLVEVVRGANTSETALATVAGYTVKMGKTPIVVKDGPGFLVNRILTPYMLAFIGLVRDGVDFAAIDRAMEAFGWPMGPAYLNDVIGMDTGTHVFDIISAGFPERLQRASQADAVQLMADRGRLGQKSGLGFYEYETDPAGKPKRSPAADSYELLASIQSCGNRELPAAQIVQRMMLPMIAEAAWCLEEGIVGTPHELDMALLLGLGFPRYLGGALKYADWLGLDKVVELCDRYADSGTYYNVPPTLRDRAATGKRYYES